MITGGDVTNFQPIFPVRSRSRQLIVASRGTLSTLSNIWRDALLMVKRYSEDAAIQAGVRADELLAEGNADGAGTWRAIIRAIEELQRMATQTATIPCFVSGRSQRSREALGPRRCRRSCRKRRTGRTRLPASP